MQQNRVAGFDAIGLPDQILRGQALQHHRGGGLVVDAVRQFQQAIGRDQAGFGIGADRRGAIGDAVAGLDVRDAGADFLDHARGLAAKPARQLRRIKPGAVVDIDEVQADRGVADTGFAGTGLAELDLLPDQNFGAAGFVEADGMRHGFTPCETTIGEIAGDIKGRRGPVRPAAMITTGAHRAARNQPRAPGPRRTRLRDPAARHARVLQGLSAPKVEGARECRVPSAPAASCALVVVKNAHEYSQRSHRKSPGIPARNGFNGFLRALPGDRAFLSPSPPGSLLLKNLTPTIEASGPHDFSVRVGRCSSIAPTASTASGPNVRDDGQRPSLRDRTAADRKVICIRCENENIFAKGAGHAHPKTRR